MADWTKVVAARLEKSRHILKLVDKFTVKVPQGPEVGHRQARELCEDHVISLEAGVLAKPSKTHWASMGSGR